MLSMREDCHLGMEKKVTVKQNNTYNFNCAWRIAKVRSDDTIL
jgi:hypothetical protein